MYSQPDVPNSTTDARSSGSGWSGWHRSLSLERKLPLIIVVLLAVLLATTLVVTYRVLTRAEEATARGRLTNAAEFIAEGAAGSMRERSEQLRQVADSPAIHALLAAGAAATPEDRERVRRIMRPLQPAAGSPFRIQLLDRKGERLAFDGDSTPPARQPALPAGDSVINTVMHVEGKYARAWTVAPVRRDGATIGYIAFELYVGGPRNAAETVRGFTGENASLYVRNTDQSVWVRNPGGPEAGPVRRDERGNSVLHERANGERTIVGEAAIAGTPWVSVVEAPLAPIQARATQAVRTLMLVSVLLMLIGTIVVWLLSRRIAQPLHSLTRAAEALAAGDYTRRVEAHGTDEIGRLGASFNLMAVEIETARRELMQRVREAQQARHEAERLHEVTEYAREASERANRAKSDFLAVMSHELRTPLNAIGGYAQLLELGIHGTLTEPQLDAMRRIARNQQHLLTLINDLLNYAKLDAGRVQYSIESVSVGDVFQNIEPLIAPQVQMHQLRFVRQNPDEDLAVRADADKLQQILLNLLGNAMKFTPAGGTITLEGTRRDGVVQIHVRDTGIGIPQDRLEAIFEPFYQGDRALNRPTDGVGLGLAISRDLARGMAGELAVESIVGHGSTFTVVLPPARALGG